MKLEPPKIEVGPSYFLAKGEAVSALLELVPWVYSRERQVLGEFLAVGQ